MKEISKFGVGEVMVNSIDRDGTGHGLDNNIWNLYPKTLIFPLFLREGQGMETIFKALKDHRINAVATANFKLYR